MIAIRGAITCQNTQKSIDEATKKLVSTVFSLNDIEKSEIVTIIFSVTKDLDAQNPATVFRNETGINDVPLMCVQEADFKQSMPNCIRILLLTNQNIQKTHVKHCYLEGAVELRPDLCEELS